MLTLVKSVADKSKTLTVALDLETLAEFAVAAQVFRARSVSSFVHEYVVGKIGEARRLISAEEFAARVEEQKAAIEARSSTKQREREKSFKLINPSTLRSLGIDPDAISVTKEPAEEVPVRERAIDEKSKGSNSEVRGPRKRRAK